MASAWSWLSRNGLSRAWAGLGLLSGAMNLASGGVLWPGVKLRLDAVAADLFAPLLAPSALCLLLLAPEVLEGVVVAWAVAWTGLQPGDPKLSGGPVALASLHPSWGEVVVAPSWRSPLDQPVEHQP